MKRKSTLILLASLAMISGTVDLTSLLNYENQPVPAYINDDNTPPSNAITDEVATLGRVLFYDKNLSVNGTIACSSCHIQEFGFSDTATVSTGLNGGTTGRSSMRLINARFANEQAFFWDERALTLEDQTTQPIQDHVEMGFSGLAGAPDIDSLVNRLSSINHYATLFNFAFGDSTVSEQRISEALAQFVRSIQSFDSKFDVGLAQVNNINQPFPNFTPAENNGKNLFLLPPPQGAGCQGCHQGPEFDIDPNSNNNGVIGVAGSPGSLDLTNTRAPSLRDLVNPNGIPNGPFMHDGSLSQLIDVIDHYDDISFNPAINPSLDVRLRGGPGGQGQNLGLSDIQKDNLVAFLLTLTGANVYTDERWSDPFDASGNITIIDGNDPVLLSASVMLQGPYDEPSGLMFDDLRFNGLLPLDQPYSTMGYTQIGTGPTSITDPAVLSVTGPNAIVDWMVIELRSQADPTSIVESRYSLLQRDGDIVDLDGISPVAFDSDPDSYWVVIKHRNHFAVCTGTPVALSATATSIDFRNPLLPTYGVDAMNNMNGVMTMWSGYINFDGVIKYIGTSNDRDLILTAIGGGTPTSVLAGYHMADCNMDGTVKYIGADNDRDPILVNIGGSIPTATIEEQIPQ